MDKSRINCILASKNPEKLAIFYSRLMEAEIEAGFNKKHILIIKDGRKILQIFCPSDRRPWPTRGKALSICIESEAKNEPIKKMVSWLEKITNSGAKIYTKPEIKDFGVEAWITDPEGNYLLLLVPQKSD